MATKFTIFAEDEGQRKQLERALLEAEGCALAGAALPVPQPFIGGDALQRLVQTQGAEAALVALPENGPGMDAAGALIAWLRSHFAQMAVMAVGPLEPSVMIVAAMRAGACEYLERPLHAEALAEAVARAAGQKQALVRSNVRGKLIAVLGARGGCGATTVAVNLALAMQAQRRKSDAPVLLLDAAPLGHAALHLNLKPQFGFPDLLNSSGRLDAALLQTLLTRHASGMDLLAGPAAPLPALAGESGHSGWLELLLTLRPLVVADLSARLDGLTQGILARADRILFVAQSDMVTLWSAAKVQQYLNQTEHLRLEMILNRQGAAPAVEDDAVASLTGAAVLWKLPNAHALLMRAIERGQPPALKANQEFGRSFRDLASLLLGRPATRRRWLPFLRPHAVQS